MSSNRRLTDLLARSNNLTHAAGPVDQLITSITLDSRTCAAHSLFIASPGERSDGHDHIDQAIDLGAQSILCSHLPSQLREGISYILTVNTRSALSKICCWFYDTFSVKAHVIGITGTDGKTTTAYYLYQLLRSAGYRVSLLSTVYRDYGFGLRASEDRMTTPEAPEVHRFLAESDRNDMDFAIIEASSHALSLKSSRLADVSFDTAVFTPITSEHLDYHCTREQYVSDKLNLIRQLSGEGPSVVASIDHVERTSMEELASSPLCSFSIDGEQPSDLLISISRELEVECSMGEFSISYTATLDQSFLLYDAAAALRAACAASGRSLPVFSDALRALRAPKGRFEVVPSPFGFVIIDYAHTPDAFTHLFTFCTKYLKEYTLSAVFGAAGRRDHAKRPLMGAAAARFCTKVFVTYEDPRDESPEDIYAEIIAGVNAHDIRKFRHIPDRKTAIDTAIASASSNEVILLLGKGHERSIEIGDGYMPWDEYAVLSAALGKEVN